MKQILEMKKLRFSLIHLHLNMFLAIKKLQSRFKQSQLLSNLITNTTLNINAPMIMNNINETLFVSPIIEETKRLL